MDLYGPVLRNYLFPAFESLRGRPTVALLAYLERTQWASRDELDGIQVGFLRRLLRHAYTHTTYYRQLFDQHGFVADSIRTAADLGGLPLMEREAARASMTTRMADAPPLAVIKKSSSGSTGRPITVMYNAESRHWRDADRWRGYGWSGYRIGQRAVHFWAAGAIPPSSRFGSAKLKVDRLLKRDLYVDCTPRGDDQLRDVLKQIGEFEPNVIVAYSQAAATLARFAIKHDLAASIHQRGPVPVLCGAERVWEHDREQIETAFGPVFETYGSREVMLMGAECEAHDGLHTSMEKLIVEVLVRDPSGRHGVRPALAGETGEVVVTDLHNLAQPLIRYVTGDLAVARGDVACICGRHLVRIGPIEGRVTETLRDGKGNAVSGLIFNVLMTALADDATQFQVVQHATGDVTFKVVPTTGPIFDPRAEKISRDFIAKYMPGITMTIDVVEDIPVTAAGKRRVVVVEPR